MPFQKPTMRFLKMKEQAKRKFMKSSKTFSLLKRKEFLLRIFKILLKKNLWRSGIMNLQKSILFIDTLVRLSERRTPPTKPLKNLSTARVSIGTPKIPTKTHELSPRKEIILPASPAPTSQEDFCFQKMLLRHMTRALFTSMMPTISHKTLFTTAI